MRTVTISKRNQTTIVKVVDNGVTEIVSSNSNRDLKLISGGVLIENDPNELILNNFKILRSELTNDGIDFSLITTDEQLLDKLADEEVFKIGNGVSVSTVTEMIDSAGNLQVTTDKGNVTDKFIKTSGYQYENGVPNESYEISERGIGLGFPVMSGYPLIDGKTFALDIMPSLGALDYGENGKAWFDIADRYIKGINELLNVLRHGMGENRATFGVLGYNGGLGKALDFVYGPYTTPLKVAGRLEINGDIVWHKVFKLSTYGQGNRKSSDLSKTASDYIQRLATDGTIIEESFNAQRDATITGVINSDDFNGKIIVDSATPITLTIDNALENNHKSNIYNIGAGAVTLIRINGTINHILTSGNSAELIKRNTDESYLIIASTSVIVLPKLTLLLTNLISAWEMDETSGTVTNDAHGSNNGTITGATANQTGKIGKSYLYDGVDDYISFGDVIDFERTDSFSISCWFKRDGLGEITLVSKMEASNNFRGILFRLNAGELNFGLRSDNAPVNFLDIEFQTLTTDLVWNHAVVTYDGSSLASGVKCYLNNVLLTSLNITSDNLSATILNNEPFNIGTLNNGAFYDFKGDIDQTAIWNKVLTVSEISDLYNSGNGLAYASW